MSWSGPYLIEPDGYAAVVTRAPACWSWDVFARDAAGWRQVDSFGTADTEEDARRAAEAGIEAQRERDRRDPWRTKPLTLAEIGEAVAP